MGEAVSGPHGEGAAHLRPPSSPAHLLTTKPRGTAARSRPSSSTSWKKKVELEARKSLGAALQFLSRVYWVQTGEQGCECGPQPWWGGLLSPSRHPYLLDVEGEEEEDAMEQGQQGAVEEAHPGDGLPRHDV